MLQVKNGVLQFNRTRKLTPQQLYKLNHCSEYTKDKYLLSLMGLLKDRVRVPSLKQFGILAWASIVKFTPHCLKIVGLEKEAFVLENVEKFNWSAAESAAWSARSAAGSAESAAGSAAWSARSAESAAGSAARLEVINLALAALDEALEVK